MLNILHLSDLQFGNTYAVDCAWNGNICRYGGYLHSLIIDTLQSEGLPSPHIIILTGDITEKADYAEYEAASEFITALHRRIEQTYHIQPVWIVLPGNHDVHRPSSERVSTTSPGDEQRRKNAMLANFGGLLRNLKETGIPVNEKPEAFHIYPKDRFRSVDFPVIIAGLNSCEAEGHSAAHHRGYVSHGQMERLRHCLRAHVSPWVFRIAALHHNIILNGPPVASFRAALRAVSANDAARLRMEAWYGSTLHNPHRVLNVLAELGFQLVLHGHQHYDGPIHLEMPQAPDNPVAHDGLTVMSAGSTGIVPGGDQPSVPSFQYYQIHRPMLSWEVEARRITLERHGNVRPQLRAHIDPVLTWPCYSTRAEKILSGITRLLAERQPPEQNWQSTTSFQIQDCLVAGHTFMDGSNLGILADRLKLELPENIKLQDWRLLWHAESNHTPERFADLTELVIDSLASIFPSKDNSISSPPGIYGDLEHLSLHDIKTSTNGHEYTVKTGLTTYLHYQTTSLSLHRTYNKGSFFEKYIADYLLNLPSNDGLALISTILQNTRYLSKRITIQALIEVTSSENNVLLLKMRSNTVGHMRGRLQFAVGGGLKVPLLHGTNATFAGAARSEIELEVGLRWNYDDMRVVCLSINRETLAPAFTVVVRISKELFDSLFQLVDDKAMLDTNGPYSAYVPRTPPRDWWESVRLIALPIGKRSLLENTNDQSGWCDLKQLWESLPIKVIDPYPGSAIAQILSTIKQTCGKVAHAVDTSE